MFQVCVIMDAVSVSISNSSDIHSFSLSRQSNNIARRQCHSQYVSFQAVSLISYRQMYAGCQTPLWALNSQSARQSNHHQRCTHTASTLCY